MNIIREGKEGWRVRGGGVVVVGRRARDSLLEGEVCAQVAKGLVNN